MENAVGTNHRVCFKAFELDLHTRELYRHGIRLRVQGQPIDVLEMLLERPGELVTREALRKKLWPEDTFVDFEHSLNSAVTRLRDALGDKADDPKYIETLPRLGYRFVAEFEREGFAVSAGAGTKHERSSLSMRDVRSDSESPNASPCSAEPALATVAAKSRSKFWRVTIFGVGTLLAGAVGFYSYIHKPLPPPHIGDSRQLTQDVRWRYKRPLGAGGGRVYFSGAPRGLFAVGGSGEIETIPLVVPWSSDHEVWASDVSPDGAYFLAWPMTDHPTLWVFTTTGKPVRYVAETTCATWSNDSKQILYLSADRKFYSVPTTSGEPHLLFTPTSGGGCFFPFSWSPDGKRIRFDSSGSIWEVASDGSNHEFLPGMKNSVSKCCGRWTPDGAFYIFASAKKVTSSIPAANQLWALDERAGQLRKPSPDPVQLTFEPMQWNFPVISQDSRTIYATGTVKQGELSRFDPQTGQVVRYLGGISADWLTFSPDGKYVAYVSYPEQKVWRANRDGSGRILLADPENGAWGLHWSPDGARILFASGSETYIVSSQGGKPERVQFPPSEKAGEFDPTWSPDGKRLSYTVDSYPNVTPNGIRILDLETHRSEALPSAPAHIHSPRWSPDGRYIFCEAEPNAGAAVFDTEEQKWMYFPSKLGWSISTWAHDSRSVYFLLSTVPLTFDGVYRISIPSGHIERVVDLTNVRLNGSPFGYWLGLDPEDHPLIMRDVGSVEIYALPLER
jgi:DNA-binding winged helix-turn-helix (wHTH) protein/Tol biopolymer transport system component